MFSPVEGGFWFSLTRPQQSWPALSGVCTRTRARRPQNRQFWGVLHRSLQGSEKILRGFTSRLLRSMPNFWCQTKVWVVKIYPQFQQSKMSWTRPRCTSCVTWNKNCLVICTYIYIIPIYSKRLFGIKVSIQLVFRFGRERGAFLKWIVLEKIDLRVGIDPRIACQTWYCHWVVVHAVSHSTPTLAD